MSKESSLLWFLGKWQTPLLRDKVDMLNVKRVTPELEVFTPQTNGEISDSIVQNWTAQALECYSINCDCSKCSIKRAHYSFICQMPKIVASLLKTYGKPKPSDFLSY